MSAAVDIVTEVCRRFADNEDPFPLLDENVTWEVPMFDHDAPFFPIYSGAHRGRWTSCSSCHTTASSYKAFTCLTCHAQTEMDGHHRGLSGYRYESQACYTCHPNGRKP